jgi:hypothetical protein
MNQCASPVHDAVTFEVTYLNSYDKTFAFNTLSKWRDGRDSNPRPIQ